MKDDTNNTPYKLPVCFIASLIFFLELCCFLLIAEKMKNIIYNLYIRLTLDDVRNIIIRGCGVPAFIIYYPKWRNNEANFWDKLSCVVGTISVLIIVGAIVVSFCQLCARILNFYGYSILVIEHRNTIAADNNRALEEGVLYHTDSA